MLLSDFQAPTEALDRILDDPRLRGASVAAYVCRLDGTELYARNPGLMLMPASNQKLFTAAFALDRLGPHRTWTTRFWKESDRIVIHAPGDPSLTHARLEEAARQLGATRDLPVFVEQAYRVPVPPTWEYEDLAQPFAPRITALTFDKGMFRLYARGGRPALEPGPFGVRIMHFPWGSRAQNLDPFGNLLLVRGELLRDGELLASFAIPEPDRAAASLFGSRMLTASRLPSRPADCEIEGSALSEIIKDCLVPSDNFLAEHLLLQAALAEGPLGDSPYAVAASRLRRFLVRTVGLSEADCRPVDGSGMSRHNLATVRGIAKLLSWAHGQPWETIWRESLASPGSGTLASRLSGLSFQGKTGTLDVCSALSGYVTSPAGDTLVVSVVANHYLCTSAEARGILDAFVKQLAEGGTSGTLVERDQSREGRVSQPGRSRAYGHRIRRPARNRALAPHGVDRGAQPAHAPAPRAQRVAVRRSQKRDSLHDLGVPLRLR